MSLGMLGRYRLIRKLAQGGMAEVFLAKSYGAHGFEKPVAIKRILSRFASDEQFVTMLIDEAKITSGLSHPNIVPVIDFNADQKDCYIVMEYVAGRSLSNLLRLLAQQDRQLSIEHLIHVIREAAVGLHHAHVKTDRNGQPLKIVHRDVSPQNILLSFDGYVKIIDFGIARARNRLARTEAGTLKGKLRYLAPEQVQGHDVDGRTDQFALGITLWESLTGRALFSGDSDVQVIDQVVAARVSDPREHNAKVPEELARSVLRALSKDRNNRYATCEAFAADLRGILARLNPDYDPASLGALLRKHFATEMEEDAGEEAEAEAELARAGVADAPPTLSPPSPGRVPQVVPAPAAEVPAHLVENTAPANAEDDEAPPAEMPRTVANAPRVVGRKGAQPTAERMPAAKPEANSPVQVRRERAQKGTRAAEARRAAEADQEKAPPVKEPLPPPEKSGVDRTLTGTGTSDELALKGVVVPMPSGVPTARPDEPTKAHFDARVEPRKQERPKTPVAPAPKPSSAATRTEPTPRVRPRGSSRSLTLLAMVSAVGGAAVAVVLGLVVVGRLDATPVKSLPLPDETTHAQDPPPKPVAPRPVPVEPATTVSQPPRATLLSLSVTPTRARVVVDGRHVADWSRPFKVGPGNHRLVVTCDGFVDEERILELADGETRQVELALQKAAPPPVVEQPKPAPEKRKDPVATPKRPEKKEVVAKGNIKIITPGTWATVAVDGRKQPDAPTIVEVPVGSHTVTLTRDGQLKTYPVTVEAGKTVTVRGEF